MICDTCVTDECCSTICSHFVLKQKFSYSQVVVYLPILLIYSTNTDNWNLLYLLMSIVDPASNIQAIDGLEDAKAFSSRLYITSNQRACIICRIV